MITKPFKVGDWTFSRDEGYVVIDLNQTGDVTLRLSIPVDVWKASVFNLLSMREVVDHDLVFDTVAAKRIREFPQ